VERVFVSSIEGLAGLIAQIDGIDGILRKIRAEADLGDNSVGRGSNASVVRRRLPSSP